MLGPQQEIIDHSKVRAARPIDCRFLADIERAGRGSDTCQIAYAYLALIARARRRSDEHGHVGQDIRVRA